MKKGIKRSLLGACLIASMFGISSGFAQVTLGVVSPRAQIPPPPSVLHPAPRLADLADEKMSSNE